MNVMRGVTLLPLLFDQDVLENHTYVKFLRQDMHCVLPGGLWQGFIDKGAIKWLAIQSLKRLHTMEITKTCMQKGYLDLLAIC